MERVGNGDALALAGETQATLLRLIPDLKVRFQDKRNEDARHTYVPKLEENFSAYELRIEEILPDEHPRCFTYV